MHAVIQTLCPFQHLHFGSYSVSSALSDAEAAPVLLLSYALSDNTYRAMRTERKDQCILISGESGAGKTEASKKILLYYAVTCPTNDRMASLRDCLLQSNPVLEVGRMLFHVFFYFLNQVVFLFLLSSFYLRLLAMPKHSGMTTPADLESTWTSSLISG